MTRETQGEADIVSGVSRSVGPLKSERISFLPAKAVQRWPAATELLCHRFIDLTMRCVTTFSIVKSISGKLSSSKGFIVPGNFSDKWPSINRYLK